MRLHNQRLQPVYGLPAPCVTNLRSGIVIIIVNIDLDGIRVRNWCRWLRKLDRLIAVLRACASRNKTNGSSRLPLQSGHRIGTLSIVGIICVYAIGAVFLIGLAGLCSSNGLGGNVVDIGTRNGSAELFPMIARLTVTYLY